MILDYTSQIEFDLIEDIRKWDVERLRMSKVSVKLARIKIKLAENRLKYAEELDPEKRSDRVKWAKIDLERRKGHLTFTQWQLRKNKKSIKLDEEDAKDDKKRNPRVSLEQQLKRTKRKVIRAEEAVKNCGVGLEWDKKRLKEAKEDLKNIKSLLREKLPPNRR